MVKQGTRFWNQLQWDLRFIWWAFAALLLLAPVEVWLEVRDFRGSWQWGIPLSILVWVLMLLVAVVGLMVVIQKDVPFGNREFWRSRPVGRGALLMSKLVVFALFAVVLGVTAMAAPFLTGGRWGLFGLGAMLWWGWALALAAVLATLSSSWVRLFLNAGIFALLVVLTIVVHQVLVPSSHEERIINQGFEVAGMGGLVLLVGGAGIAVVIWQYLVPHPRWGMAFFGAILVGGMLLILREPEFDGFVRLANRKLQKEAKGQVLLDLQWREDRHFNGEHNYLIRVGRKSPVGFVERVQLKGNLIVNGKAVGDPKWEDERNLSRAFTPSSLEGFRDVSEYPRREDESDEVLIQVRHSVSDKEAKAWGESLLSYQGEAWIVVGGYHPLANFPFGEEKVIESQGLHLQVSAPQQNRRGLALSYKWMRWTPAPFQTIEEEWVELYLVHESLREFVLLDISFSGNRGVRTAYGAGEVELSRDGAFNVGGKSFESAEERDEWLAGCEVQLYLREQKGVLHQPVELKEISAEKILN